MAGVNIRVIRGLAKGIATSDMMKCEERGRHVWWWNLTEACGNCKGDQFNAGGVEVGGVENEGQRNTALSRYPRRRLGRAELGYRLDVVKGPVFYDRKQTMMEKEGNHFRDLFVEVLPK